MIKKILSLLDNLKSEEKTKYGYISYWVEFDDKVYLESIYVSYLKKDRLSVKKKLEKIQSKPNFLYWVDSDEGIMFFNKNENHIINDILTIEKKPWYNNIKYKINKKQNDIK